MFGMQSEFEQFEGLVAADPEGDAIAHRGERAAAAMMAKD